MFNWLNDTDTVQRIVAKERTLATQAENSLRINSLLTLIALFKCSGCEVILDLFNRLNNTETVRRIVAAERTMASQAENSLRMTSVSTIMPIF